MAVKSATDNSESLDESRFFARKPSKFRLKLDEVDEILDFKWVDYREAQKVRMRLRFLLRYKNTIRPPCMLILGDTNNGKTSLIRNFAYRAAQISEIRPNKECVPIVYVQAPPAPDLGALYEELLREVNAVHSPSWRPDRKRVLISDLFPELGVRMIVVDEVNNLLQAKPDQIRLFFNGLKNLTNDLGIPIVAVGTPDVEPAFQTNQQIGNRFKPCRLPRWDAGKDYASFVRRVLKRDGFEAADDLITVAFVNRIHALTEGLTGETTELLQKAMIATHEAGRKRVEAADINNTDWVPPGERRAKAR